MKKPTVIIGKKQIILSCLTLMLGIAVYVNYTMADNDLAGGDLVQTAGDSYGETEFVNAAAADDYFAQARLERQASRDEAVQTLQSVMGGGDLTEDEMVTNALNAVEVSKLIESESTIESLILSQGFSDCVAYLDGQSAKIVVKTEGLEAGQAAAIKEIILGEAEIPVENIRIFEVK